MLMENNIRFHVIGRMDELSPDVQEELRTPSGRTAAHTGMLFNIALNYGGRAEIVDAVRAALVRPGRKPDDDRRGAPSPACSTRRASPIPTC